jgi:hypothetical protein
MVIVCGVGMCLCGASMLYILARPIIGLGPFTHWQNDEFTELFLFIRRIAFSALALGLTTIIGGYLWLWRFNSKQ